MIRARGAALLIVMWLIVLLSALVGAFALTARIESLQGRTLSQGVVADQAARAGLEYAITRIVDPDPRRLWQPDGREYDWRFEGSRIRLKIVDESGKVDLNNADPDLLGALFRTVGVEQDEAARLAAAIVDWRDGDDLSQAQGGAEDPQYAEAGLPYGAKDAPFDTVPELQQVLGMTPEVYEQVLPHLTVYAGASRPDPRYADGVVLQAMGLDAEMMLAQRKASAESSELGALVGSGSGTYSIDSRARLGDGRETVLRAIVRTSANRIPGSAYTALRWEEGATQQ